MTDETGTTMIVIEMTVQRQSSLRVITQRERKRVSVREREGERVGGTLLSRSNISSNVRSLSTSTHSFLLSL